ncbi:MAG: S8 family serine peptidase [Elusimicrobia bacterium]|nr:S8 family serine peptidase [Elusimicrobiota bacterium]
MSLALALLLGLAGGAWGAPAQARRPAVLVKWKAAPAQAVRSAGADALQAASASAPLAGLLSRHRIRSLRPIDPPAPQAGGLRPLGGGEPAPDLSRTYVAELDVPAERLEETVAALNADPAVEYAEPDRVRRIQKTPDDPYLSSRGSWGQAFGDLHGLRAIGCPEAWDLSEGEGVVVAVLDTGIDSSHPDIAPNLWRNPGELPGNGRDDDGNGYVDDVIGWDFVGPWVLRPRPDNDPADGNGHGTHVAGTIAAVGGDGRGIVGVAPKAKVMILKTHDDLEGNGMDSDAVSAIRYATRHGARVINMSWGGPEESRTLREALQAAHAVGVVLVAAAGNRNEDSSRWSPAGLSEVITVAALDPDGAKASFSNFGKVDVAAPGIDILSLHAAGASLERPVSAGYALMDGTSMAAPHVAGLAALILGRDRNLTRDRVRELILNTADDVQELGVDRTSGSGRINAFRALYWNVPPAITIVNPPPDAVYPREVYLQAEVTDHDAPGEPDVTFEVDGGRWRSRIQGNGRGSYYHVFPLRALADGRHWLTVIARDGNGRASEKAVSFDVDNVAGPDFAAPRVTVTAPAPGAAVAGDSQVFLIADAADEQGAARLRFTLDGRDLGEAAGSLDGSSWSLALRTTEWTDGPHLLAARAWDAAGNQAESEPVRIFIANGRPRVRILSPEPGSAAGVQAPLRVAVDWLEGVAPGAVAAYLDAAPSARLPLQRRPDGDYVGLLDLAPGANAYTVEACDQRLAPCGEASAVVVSDRRAPAVTIVSPAAGEEVGADAELALQAVDDAGLARVELRVEGLAGPAASLALPGRPREGRWTLSFDSRRLPDGNRRISAHAFDAAGNEGVTAGAVNIQNAKWPSPPSGVHVKASSPYSIRLEWDPPAGAFSGRYRLEVARDEKFADTLRPHSKRAIDTPDAEVSALDPDAEYFVRVRGVDAAGRVSSPSGHVRLRTPAAAPKPGEDVGSIADPEEGGVVEGRVRIAVPPRAVDAPVTLTAEPVEDAELASESAQRLAGNRAFRFGPAGQRFRVPAIVTLPYVRGAGRPAVHYYNAATRSWELVAGSRVDEQAGTVSAPVSHFSIYAALAVPEQAGGATLRELYAFPNPTRGATPTLRAELSGGADSVEARVYGLSGELVETVRLSGQTDSVGPVLYEARLAAGLPSGVYSVVVTATSGAGSSTGRTKLAVVR